MLNRNWEIVGDRELGIDENKYSVSEVKQGCAAAGTNSSGEGLMKLQLPNLLADADDEQYE